MSSGMDCRPEGKGRRAGHRSGAVRGVCSRPSRRGRGHERAQTGGGAERAHQVPLRRGHHQTRAATWLCTDSVGRRSGSGRGGGLRAELPWIDAIRERLRGRPAALLVRNIDNARLTEEANALALLAQPGASSQGGEIYAPRFMRVGPPELIRRSSIGWIVIMRSGSLGQPRGSVATMRFSSTVVASRRSKRPCAHLFSTNPSRPPLRGRRWVHRPRAKAPSEKVMTDLRNHLRDSLPDFMVPSAFVVVSSLPLTPNGKIDRKALPAPERTRQVGVRAYAAPTDDIERQIAAVWQELLGLEQVGVADNFFDLRREFAPRHARECATSAPNWGKVSRSSTCSDIPP